jgi:hypothetical protein
VEIEDFAIDRRDLPESPARPAIDIKRAFVYRTDEPGNGGVRPFVQEEGAVPRDKVETAVTSVKRYGFTRQDGRSDFVCFCVNKISAASPALPTTVQGVKAGC